MGKTIMAKEKSSNLTMTCLVDGLVSRIHWNGNYQVWTYLGTAGVITDGCC